MRQVFRWLVNEDEIRESPRGPHASAVRPRRSAAVLRTEELERLLAACAGASSRTAETRPSSRIGMAPASGRGSRG